MDLLGSIMGKMTGPPKPTDKEIAERKKAREMAKNMEAKQREEAKEFRQAMEKKVEDFLKQNSTEHRSLSMPPMTKYQRSVLHDVCEVAGLVAHSFGLEDVDRHSIVWKKEFAPCEDELAALRAGKEWDPVQSAIEKELTRQREEQEAQEAKKRKKEKFVPKSNYRQKYEHLIGTEAELQQVRKAEANKSYGMVSAESKKDRRTVEQVQAEIRAKKRAAAAVANASAEPGDGTHDHEKRSKLAPT